MKELESRVEGVDLDEDPSSWRPFVRVLDHLKEKVAKLDPSVANREGLKATYIFFGSFSAIHYFYL